MSASEGDQSDTMADMPLPKVLTLIGVQTAIFAALGLALWVFSGRPTSAFVTTSALEIGQGLALAAALIATSAGLARLFPRYVEWLVRSQASNYPFLKHGISIPAIVFISLCAGVGEEALFRGGLQTLLADHIPISAATALAALLFALIHFAKPLNSALIFAIGCLFGAIYWQTGSLLIVITGHAVYDVYALWSLQKEMHRLGVFDEPGSKTLPPDLAHETLTSDIHKNTTGEIP